MKSSYKFKFFVNASHAIRWQEGTGEAHPHTYELICEVSLAKFLKFNEVEEQIHQVLDPLEGQFLNDLPAFKEIDAKVTDIGCQLLRIEVGESPTRYFCLAR